jgi:hypothetical protein
MSVEVYIGAVGVPRVYLVYECLETVLDRLAIH